MIDPAEELRRLTTVRPIDALHEDDGDVLLWRFDRRAKPFTMVGDREDVDWWYCPNDRPTHWSPIPQVETPA